MHDPTLNRRDLLAFLPAALAAPVALAQAVPGGEAGAKPAPVRMSPNASKGPSEGLTMPFAMAACWADDLGALDAVRMRARLDCTIGFRSARMPASDDDSCSILVSMGAAIECATMLAAASMAGFTLFYAPPKESGDMVQLSVRLGQVRRQATPEVVRSALGIFGRPDPRGAFKPDGAVPPECLEKMRVAMIEQGITCAVVEPSARPRFVDALFTLAKGSPALASAVGSRELWETGCTPLIMGRAVEASMQTAITAGRCIQRAALFACQYDLSADARLLLPGALEAAAAGSAERASASNALVSLLPGSGFEPLAVVRVGRLAAPAPRAAPRAFEMLSPSVEALPAKAPAAGSGPSEATAP